MASLKLVFLLVGAILALQIAGQSTCSASEPCAEGCCSKYGSCGFGPSFCGSGNCISNCNAKAQCGQYAPPGQSACPLNVCCSQFGFCGTTSDFCGTGCQNGCKPVTEPSCGGQSAASRTIGYYESWSAQRPCDAYSPSNINPKLWTHLYYSFALIDSNFQMSTMNSYDDKFYPQFTGLKSQNPTLKTFISVGGWAAGGKIFSQMTSTLANRQTFILSAIAFMQTYGFDGIDIDWEYPSAPDRGGVPADKENYVSFLKELRAACGSAFGISATLPSSYWYLQGFDVVGMEPYVDWFNFLSYDIHGTWDGDNPYTQAVVNPHTNLTEIALGLDLLWRNSIQPNKVVLGLAFYGRSFTLANPSCKTPGCPFSGGGTPGPCTQTSGILSNSEIQAIIKQHSLTPTLNKQAAVNYITWDNNQWVSYDDATTYALKTTFANQHCMGGRMVWALDLDNPTTSLSTNNLQLQGLANIGDDISKNEAFAANKLQTMSEANNVNLITFWTACSIVPQCPVGFRMLTYGAGKTFDADLNVMSGQGCHAGISGYNRALCIESAVQTSGCGWFGKPAGCGATCPPTWIQIAQNSWPQGSNAQCAPGKYSHYCCQTVDLAASSVQACQTTYGDNALGGGFRSGPGTVVKRLFNEVLEGIDPYTLLPQIYGTELECASLLNQETDPTSPYKDPVPGFLPTDIGPIILNALPGMWEYSFSLEEFIWNPIVNLAYPNPPAAGCTTTITNTYSSTSVSRPIYTVTCDGNRYPQPCLHYSSVINNGGNANLQTLTCQVVLGNSYRRAPYFWDRQHDREWRYWIPIFYNPNHINKLGDCQRDEYPPFAFQYPVSQQWIRFLPGYQNGGAGQLWQGICSNPPRSSTTVRTFPPVGQVCNELKNVTYFVNAMTMRFANMPNLPGYGAYANPCYPQTLTADGGYALFTQDPWYIHVGPQYQPGTTSYPAPPTPQLTQGKTMPRSSPAKRWLQEALMGNPDDIVVDTGNSSRPATPEELWEVHKLFKCKSPGCVEELAKFDLSPEDVVDLEAEHNALMPASIAHATAEVEPIDTAHPHSDWKPPSAAASRPRAEVSYVRATGIPRR